MEKKGKGVDINANTIINVVTFFLQLIHFLKSITWCNGCNQKTIVFKIKLQTKRMGTWKGSKIWRCVGYIE